MHASIRDVRGKNWQQIATKQLLEILLTIDPACMPIASHHCTGDVPVWSENPYRHYRTR